MTDKIDDIRMRVANFPNPTDTENWRSGCYSMAYRASHHTRASAPAAFRNTSAAGLPENLRLTQKWRMTAGKGGNEGAVVWF